jgi:hypothetical protein
LGKIKQICFYIVLIAAPTLLLLGIGEVLARAFFPQFKNQVTNEHYTLGKRFHTDQLLGMPVRVPVLKDGGTQLQTNKVILVFGDSISGGHGLAYEDIFWAHWERLLKLEYENPPEVIAIVATGNNFVDNFEQIKNAVSKFRATQIDILGIIYQFNFNDIAPYTKQDLLNLEHIKTTSREWWKTMVRFRLQYLNQSVLQRVLSHYIARIFGSKSEDCEERGVSALGSVTWSYGALPFRKEAAELWMDFEKGMQEVKEQIGNVPFYILISPILYDIDHENIHNETFEKTNFAWNCQTLDPRIKLQKIADNTNIPLVDPTQYIRQHFLARIEEGNPERFFFVSDDNHFNHITSIYLADFSYFSIIKKILKKASIDTYSKIEP